MMEKNFQKFYVLFWFNFNFFNVLLYSNLKWTKSNFPKVEQGLSDVVLLELHLSSLTDLQTALVLACACRKAEDKHA